MCQECNLWKCRYENLRRSKEKEIEKLAKQRDLAASKYLDLVNSLPISFEEKKRLVMMKG